ncbi:NPC intracellular cholesterol transporter 2 homolog a-like [Ylistrum balloti]|uniref:NPC intracellular cholesterol transporter 2 homolog a-like n=1 Tax=Ylistrum balloti TaxID=509963 RepID=UPI002905D017|nr:NPC intracellular cholesterol transporter 2 homolog a-like [Ylistrum balloti]
MGLLKTLLLCVFISFATAKNWSECLDTQTTGTIHNITVKNCEPTASICNLEKNTNASLTVTFSSSEEQTKAVANVHGVIAGVSVPFPVPNPDACQYSGSGIECPINATQSYTYTHLVPVKSVYPNLQLLVNWKLEGSDGIIFCFMLNVQIVD